MHYTSSVNRCRSEYHFCCALLMDATLVEAVCTNFTLSSSKASRYYFTHLEVQLGRFFLLFKMSSDFMTVVFFRLDRLHGIVLALGLRVRYRMTPPYRSYTQLPKVGPSRQRTYRLCRHRYAGPSSGSTQSLRSHHHTMLVNLRPFRSLWYYQSLDL